MLSQKEHVQKKAAVLVKTKTGEFEVQATNVAREVLGTFPNIVLAEMFLEQVNSLCSSSTGCPCSGMEYGIAAA